MNELPTYPKGTRTHGVLGILLLAIVGHVGANVCFLGYLSPLGFQGNAEHSNERLKGRVGGRDGGRSIINLSVKA